MLSATVVGNLGGDATVREVGDQRVISFSVAHNERYKDAQTGQVKDRTVWVSCSYWRRPDAIGVAQYLTKGKLVAVTGTPSARPYEANGEARASLDLRVDRLELLGGGDTQQRPQPQQPAQQPVQQQSAQQPDDLPF